MAKKVLILCRHYYPHYGPQAQRMASFARHLPGCRWEPTVLCPESTAQNDTKHDPQLVGKDFCRTIRTPYNISSKKAYFDFLVRKALRDMSLDVVLVQSPMRIYRDMFTEADSLLKKEKFDMILATSPLPLALAAADKLSRKHQVPWVADFRDLPAQHKKSLSRFSPYHLLIKMIKGFCKSAGAVVTVSKPLAERLTSWMERDVSLVYNGYNPDDFGQNVETGKDYFTLVYCGTIHTGRNPELLTEALDLVIKKDSHRLDRFGLLIYGVSKICFHRYFENRPCSGVIQNKGRVPFSESIKAQQQASAVLLLPSLGLKGLLTAKIFEYLGAGRPVLSVPGDGGVTDELLAETRAGVVGRTAEQIADILEKWIDEWERTGKVEYNPIPEKIQIYTRRKQTEKLAQILDEVTAAKD